MAAGAGEATSVGAAAGIAAGAGAGAAAAGSERVSWLASASAAASAAAAEAAAEATGASGEGVEAGCFQPAARRASRERRLPSSAGCCLTAPAMALGLYAGAVCECSLELKPTSLQAIMGRMHTKSSSTAAWQPER